MSSGDSSTGPPFRAFTCQKIKPAAKIIAMAPAMSALLVEFKILSFPKTIDAAPTRAALHLSTTDERTLSANHRRLSAVFRQSIAPRAASTARATRECPSLLQRYGESQGRASPKTFPRLSRE